MQFKLWDTVKLKTGGPEMVITTLMVDISNNEYAICKWTDDDKQLNMSDFLLNELEVIKQD
jgi:uncharacterized protein YodC (DUF2158 family)